MRIRPALLSGKSFERILESKMTDPDYRQIHSTIAAFGNLYDGLAAIKDNRDPTKTQAAIELDHSKAYDRATETATRRMKDAIGRLAKMEEKLNEGLNIKFGFNRPHPNAAEYREVLRGMTESNREAFIRRSIDEGNADILYAVSDAPAELSKLTKDRVEKMRKVFIDKHAPDYREEIELIDKATEHLSLSYETFSKSTRELKDPNLEIKANQEKTLADTADANFKALTSE